MARKKLEGDDGKSNFRVGLLYFTIAAWCFSVANADVYIVMLKEQGLSQIYSTMGVEGMSASAQHDVMLDSWLGIASTNYRKIHDYSSVFDGVAVDLTESQVALLRSNDAVSRVVKDDVMTISTSYTPEYLHLPTGAWNRSGGVGNAGEDVVIGVVDTGIYPDHPSFANFTTEPYPPHPTFTAPCGTDSRVPNGFCNGKIVGAQQFFASAIANGNVSLADVSSPLDGSGHGSHCAGTAAGNNRVPTIVLGQDFGFASGIAPRARISVYKALNENGQGYTADIIAAIDKAVADGVHVLSLSLGPETASVGVVTYTDSFMVACLGAVKAGVFVAHAAGNSGPTVSSISSWSPWVSSVGAASTDRTYSGLLITADGRNFSGLGLSPPTPNATNYALISASDAVAAGDVANADFDCADVSVLNAALIKGKILVCSLYGTTSAPPAVSLAYTAAVTTGAVGVVLLTSVTYIDNLSPTYWDFRDFPALVITGPTSFQSFLTFYASAKRNAVGPTGRLSGALASYTKQPSKVAAFSARGPDYSIRLDSPSPTAEPLADVLKPNIVAPGVDIWAAWTPLDTSNLDLFRGEKFALMRGTSMATPHIAGVAALVLQKHPTWSPSAVASALSTTASPVDSTGAPLAAYDYELDESGTAVNQFLRPGNAFDFGSGFVDPTAALDPGLIFDATYDDYVRFLCAEQVALQGIIQATCPATPGLGSDLNLPSITVANLVTSRTVPRNVTNVGAGVETYTAVITNPTGVDVVVDPPTFTLALAATQLLTVTLTALNTSVYVNQTGFGSVYLNGNLGHRVQVPVTVTYKQP